MRTDKIYGLKGVRLPTAKMAINAAQISGKVHVTRVMKGIQRKTTE